MGQLVQVIPFVGILLSYAILPGLLPRLWHRRMAAIVSFWVALEILLQTLERGGRSAGLALWQVTFAEFLPFIFLLLALYALGGGISIRGGVLGRPGGNLLLLSAGTILASIMGTIGAALVLIHPLLAANGYRHEKRHLVMAFIILVGNAGGALSPLGDPPLLVGFLRGVPFFWPLIHLLLPLLLLAVPVLALTFGLDVWLARKEPRPRPEKLRVRGLLNILLLLLLIIVIPLEGVWHPGNVTVLSAAIPTEHLAMMLVEIGCILVSEIFTPNAIRSQNRFAWRAMREITILFFAIFATIGPAFTLLQAAQIPPMPLAWFWASGLFSAVLDSAPTYLIFFEAGGGHATALTQGSAPLLRAIAAGSVFFGPLTYLGNAPNLMIREIAARRGVRMPGFFTFAGIMALVLMPIYALMSVVFF